MKIRRGHPDYYSTEGKHLYALQDAHCYNGQDIEDAFTGFYPFIYYYHKPSQNTDIDKVFKNVKEVANDFGYQYVISIARKDSLLCWKFVNYWEWED